jgi:type I restriction enzyme S subunit
MIYSNLILGDIAKTYRGLPVPRDRTSNENEIPYLHYGDLYKKYSNFLDLDKVKKDIIKINKEEKIKKYQYLHTDDIVINLTSENYEDLGKSIYIKNDDAILVSGMETTIIRIENIKEFYPLFLKYYFDSEYFYKDIMQYVRGMKVFRVNPKDLLRAKLPEIDYSKQIRIASYVKNLDDKIELNNKINQNLEELAQTLYKRWFVDFEFPNENGDPYQSSGGEMVECELGLIPKGWEIKRLNDFVIKNSIKTSPDNEKKLIDMANMPSYSISLSTYDSGDKLTTNTYLMKKKTFLYGSIRPYLGKYGIAPFDGITTGTIHNFEVNDCNNYSFVASTIFSKAFNNFCIKLSQGTKMPVIKWDDFKSYQLAYNGDISKKLNDILINSYDLIIENVLQNDRLSKLRDTLLPKLISGEIEVPIEGNA